MSYRVEGVPGTFTHYHVVQILLNVSIGGRDQVVPAGSIRVEALDTPDREETRKEALEMTKLAQQGESLARQLAGDPGRLSSQLTGKAFAALVKAYPGRRVVGESIGGFHQEYVPDLEYKPGE